MRCKKSPRNSEALSYGCIHPFWKLTRIMHRFFCMVKDLSCFLCKLPIIRRFPFSPFSASQFIMMPPNNPLVRQNPVNSTIRYRIHSFTASCPAQVRLDVFHLSRDGGHVNTRITCDKRCRRTDTAVIRLDAPDHRPPICAVQCVFAHVENNVRYRFRPFPVFDLAGAASMTTVTRKPHRRVFRRYQAFDQLASRTDFAPYHPCLRRAIQPAQPLAGGRQWLRRQACNDAVLACVVVRKNKCLFGVFKQFSLQMIGQIPQFAENRNTACSQQHEIQPRHLHTPRH